MRALRDLRARHARRVDVDRDHASRPLGERARERAQSAADLEDRTRLRGIESVDDGVEHVPVDEEVLAEPRVTAQADPARHRGDRAGVGQVDRMTVPSARRLVSHSRPG